MTTDELRAKFEAACAKSNWYIARHPSGTYVSSAVEDAWDGYQLGYESRDAEVAELQSIINGQQDTIGALKRKLARARESTK